MKTMFTASVAQAAHAMFRLSLSLLLLLSLNQAALAQCLLGQFVDVTNKPISFGQLLLHFVELFGGDIFHKSHVQDGPVAYPVVRITVTFHQAVITAQLF